MDNNLYIKWQQSQPCDLDQLEAFIKENNLYDPSSKYNIPNKFKQLKIKYNCEVCGKENIIKYDNFLDKGSRRLCTGCKLKDTWIEKYGSMENYAAQALKAREKTCEEKYGEGIRNSFQDPQVKEKIKQTNLEKYGVENPAFSKELMDRARSTMKERYGAENPMHVPEFVDKIKEDWKNKTQEERSLIREKTRQTCLEKYDAESTTQLEEVKLKMRQTNLMRYGVESYTQTPECKERSRNTSIQRYGVPFYTQTQEYKERVKITSLRKYGVAIPAQSEIIKDKIRKTNIERYGYPCNFGNPEVKAKIKRTFKEKYGVENPSQYELFKIKREETTFKRYGSKYFSQSEFFKVFSYKYRFENQSFDSSWELAFYAYQKSLNKQILRLPQRIKYIDDLGNSHFYHPDFKVEENLIEIKGDQFFDEKNNLIVAPYVKNLSEEEIKRKEIILKAKAKCIKDNNVIILRQKDLKECFQYMENTYGKEWVEKFKVNNSK